MQSHQADYFGTYRTMKMTRDTKGVLVVEFHSNGPEYPLMMVATITGSIFICLNKRENHCAP